MQPNVVAMGQEGKSCFFHALKSVIAHALKRAKAGKTDCTHPPKDG